MGLTLRLDHCNSGHIDCVPVVCKLGKMRFATLNDGRRIEATPGGFAHCPGCGGDVLAKCGSVVAWHWAHRSLADCDDWAEPDTEWHTGWQDIMPAAYREVVIGNHRADIVMSNGMVLELQHSYLSCDEISKRERHYGRMAWLFDATRARKCRRLLVFPKDPKTRYATFRWKHARKTLTACRMPVFLDIGGDEVLKIGRIYTDDRKFRGWGRLYQKREIVDAIRRGMPDDGSVILNCGGLDLKVS